MDSHDQPTLSPDQVDQLWLDMQAWFRKHGYLPRSAVHVVPVTEAEKEAKALAMGYAAEQTLKPYAAALPPIGAIRAGLNTAGLYPQERAGLEWNRPYGVGN